MGLYGMGTGWTLDQWRQFSAAQQAAAVRAEAAAARIDQAVANLNGNKSTSKAFEKVFGKGSATAENMSRVSQTLKGMVTALRDDGRHGYIANAISASEAFRQTGRTDTFGLGMVNGRTIWANVDHGSFTNQSALSSMIGHESAHNVGLEHGALNGVIAYRHGTPAERNAYKHLPVDGRLHNPDNYVDFAR